VAAGAGATSFGAYVLGHGRWPDNSTQRRSSSSWTSGRRCVSWSASIVGKRPTLP